MINESDYRFKMLRFCHQDALARVCVCAHFRLFSFSRTHTQSVCLCVLVYCTTKVCRVPTLIFRLVLCIFVNDVCSVLCDVSQYPQPFGLYDVIPFNMRTRASAHQHTACTMFVRAVSYFWWHFHPVDPHVYLLNLA